MKNGNNSNKNILTGHILLLKRIQNNTINRKINKNRNIKMKN